MEISTPAVYKNKGMKLSDVKAKGKVSNVEIINLKRWGIGLNSFSSDPDPTLTEFNETADLW